jgi:hypothetical protein
MALLTGDEHDHEYYNAYRLASSFRWTGAAAALSASARGATPPGLAAVPARGKALETRYRTIDVGGLEIFYREASPAAAPVVLQFSVGLLLIFCCSLA